MPWGEEDKRTSGLSAPAFPSRADSLFIWVCKQPQFPPTADRLISCSSATRPVSEPISFPQAITHTASPLPSFTSLGRPAEKWIPEEMSFAPIPGQPGMLREIRAEPRSLISPCDDQGTYFLFFFFSLPFGTSEVRGKIARAKDK